jgi:hypothetical protein
MPDLAASLARIRGAWMAGQSALEYCPGEWRDAVAGEDGECALAALAGHAATVLFRPAPTAPIAPRPLLPRLALPSVPEAVRPWLRRLLTRKSTVPIERPLIDLVTARGFALHPADWLPSPRDDWAPDIYAPWLDWLRAESAPAPASDFKLETYEQWPWAERRAALTALRHSDPVAAGSIITAKAAGEPAERRLKLIEILEINLSEADCAFLEGLATDRSERVQALAGAYLARLGRGADAEALATELAAMVELGQIGLLRRRTQLAINALKNAAQETRRRELFKLVSLTSLARALGVPETPLIETAPNGSPDGIEAFVQMVAATGSEEARRQLLDQMLEDADMPLRQAQPLGPRLTTTERRTLLPRIMQRDTDAFDTTLALMGRNLGEAPLAALLASPGYAALENTVNAALSGEDAQRAAAGNVLDAMLSRVALLVTAAAAAELAKRLTAAGLSAADPKLELLHLNAALETSP